MKVVQRPVRCLAYIIPGVLAEVTGMPGEKSEGWLGLSLFPYVDPVPSSEVCLGDLKIVGHPLQQVRLHKQAGSYARRTERESQGCPALSPDITADFLQSVAQGQL